MRSRPASVFAILLLVCIVILVFIPLLYGILKGLSLLPA
jgi:hypothetical protein